MSWDGGRSLGGWVVVNRMSSALADQITAVLFKMTDKD